jgi:hypothetical protein
MRASLLYFTVVLAWQHNLSLSTPNCSLDRTEKEENEIRFLHSRCGGSRKRRCKESPSSSLFSRSFLPFFLPSLPPTPRSHMHRLSRRGENATFAAIQAAAVFHITGQAGILIAVHTRTAVTSGSREVGPLSFAPWAASKNNCSQPQAMLVNRSFSARGAMSFFLKALKEKR